MCYALCNLVPFVQFKEREKTLMEECYFLVKLCWSCILPVFKHKNVNEKIKKTDFNVYIFPARAHVTLTSVIISGGKKIQTGRREKYFLQTTLTLSVPAKLKNTIFEIPIIP